MVHQADRKDQVQVAVSRHGKEVLLEEVDGVVEEPNHKHPKHTSIIFRILFLVNCINIKQIKAIQFSCISDLLITFNLHYSIFMIFKIRKNLWPSIVVSLLML